MLKSQVIRILDAQLRYYFHIQNPEDLTDEEWAMRIAELHYIRNQEAQQ